MSWFDFFRRAMGRPEQLFHVGQEVARINDGKWVNSDGEQFIGPGFSEVVKVRLYYRFYGGQWYIKVDEYPHAYGEREFAPVMSDDQLEDQVNAIDELILPAYFKGSW